MPYTLRQRKPGPISTSASNWYDTADVAAITKLDLAEACEFDRDLARANIHAVRPGMRVFETSAKRGTGLDEWLDDLAERRATLTAG